MKRKQFDIENVLITDFAAEGKAIAKIPQGDGAPLVVFVSYCLPGDVVDLHVVKRRSYAEGRVLRFRQFSEQRIAPPCPHFGTCGGCKWQHAPYELQLQMKQQQVIDQLTRIGHLQLPPVSPILGSEEIFHYRNKLEFAASNKKWRTKEEMDQAKQTEADGNEPEKPLSALGFHISGAFDKILQIDECWLMHPLHNDLRNDIHRWTQEHGMTYFDPREQVGLLRNITIRCNDKNEWMLIVQFKFAAPGDQTLALALMEHIKETFPQIISLYYVDNQKCNDTINDLPLTLYHGQPYIIQTMEDLQFRVGPKSFYQTNTHQALRLYQTVRELADPQADQTLYDLYTGTGTIANFVARKARQVVGIEYVPEAIEDAKVNSEINHIENTRFYAGDMKDLLTPDFIRQNEQPDIIITDPPRAGMHASVIETILQAQPKRIVYVSCNPATQARDLQSLTTKYDITAVQPVDMFPHTPHVENVVRLDIK